MAMLLYRAAALIVKDNKLLVAKNAQHPLYYTIGGAVEINETSQEAAIREVYEELGKFNLVPEFLKTKSFDSITHVQHIISREDIP